MPQAQGVTIPGAEMGIYMGRAPGKGKCEFKACKTNVNKTFISFIPCTNYVHIRFLCYSCMFQLLYLAMLREYQLYPLTHHCLI